MAKADVPSSEHINVLRNEKNSSGKEKVWSAGGDRTEGQINAGKFPNSIKLVISNEVESVHPETCFKTT